MFSTRFLLNIGLVIFLAILISIAVLSGKKDKLIPAFSPLNINEIFSVKIMSGESNIELIKSDTKWKIIKPFDIEADDFRIDAIVNIISTKEETHYTVAKADLKKYSLDPPKATLILNQQEFLFGTTSSVNNKRYVLTNNKLFLVDDTFYPLMSSGYKNLIRRQLFDSPIKISEITSDSFHIFKNENKSWQTNKQTISADNLKRFVDNWQFIQAYAVSSAIAPYIGTKVIIKTADGKNIERIISKNDFSTTVTNPELGLSYQFDITAFDSLTQTDYFVAKDTDKEK
ncbi:MAG: DUF4340 domain-containing protein [Gammaproteobacteria bacterium]|nr:DUF4340 domain-containing protein [Gammaproteobacteria bacterium]